MMQSDAAKINPAMITLLVVIGNILDYYDFLLFAHLGPLITPLFFPGVEVVEAHILSLFLFGFSFVIRPIGGYVFGRISDRDGRKIALIKSIKWAVFPTIALAFLPSYESYGIAATIAFLLLRLFQGFSLGGEYPSAGTYLFEYHKKNRGLVSGVLSGSGTIGSLLGLGMAYLCLQDGAPDWLWRVAFLLGGLGGVISYSMRKHLMEITQISQDCPSLLPAVPAWKCGLLVAVGLFVGTSVWLPSTYSNFYVTKIMGYSAHEGVLATLTALIGYIVLTPFFGALSDRIGHYRIMLWASLLAIPASIIFFFLLYQGHVILAQLGLISVAACFGAPIHVVMNSLFPRQTRARSVGLYFMAGLSLGGLAPSLIGYMVNYTSIQALPAYFFSCVACVSTMTLYFCWNQYRTFSSSSNLQASPSK